MNEDKPHYVVIADDCGWNTALIGPFTNQAAADEWVERQEAEDEANGVTTYVNEPYCVLPLDKPSDYEQ